MPTTNNFESYDAPSAHELRTLLANLDLRAGDAARIVGLTRRHMYRCMSEYDSQFSPMSFVHLSLLLSTARRKRIAPDTWRTQIEDLLQED